MFVCSLRYIAALVIWALLIFNSLLAQSEPVSGNRAELVERAIAIAEATVPNPTFVSGVEWEQFKQAVRDLEIQTLRDADFHRAFNEAADQLLFTHFRLHWQPRSYGNSSDEPAIALTWPKARIALVQVHEFSGDPDVFTTIMSQVIESEVESLIIDLRGNTGGSFPTAVALTRAIRNEAMDAGAFLTRGWFDRNSDYPDVSQYAEIPALQVLDLTAFAAQLQRDGAARLVLPAHDDPIFNGQLVLLTDRDTASTCEPLVYLFKQQGATVIGEPTEGAMLSAEHFRLNDTFRLFVPVADYVTPSLTRLDRRGVQPTIEVAADQALVRALKLLSDADQI